MVLSTGFLCSPVFAGFQGFKLRYAYLLNQLARVANSRPPSSYWQLSIDTEKNPIGMHVKLAHASFQPHLDAFAVLLLYILLLCEIHLRNNLDKQTPSRLHFLVKRHRLPYEVCSYLVTMHTALGWRRNTFYHVYLPRLQNCVDSAWVTKQPLLILPIDFPGQGGCSDSYLVRHYFQKRLQRHSGWE